MTATATVEQSDGVGTLEHDALFYATADDYLAGVLGFVRDGLERDEPVLVAVPGCEPGARARRPDSRTKIPHVRLRDMTVAGRNPGRIIGTVLSPLRREHPDRRVRIVGEPIWAGRTDEEYPACAEHEALINVALARVAGVHPVPVRHLGSAGVGADRCHPYAPRSGLVHRAVEQPDLRRSRRGRRIVRRAAPPVPVDADMLVIRSTTGPRAARLVVHDAASSMAWPPSASTTCGWSPKNWRSTLSCTPVVKGCCRCGPLTSTSWCRCRTVGASPIRSSAAGPRTRRTSATGSSSSIARGPRAHPSRVRRDDGPRLLPPVVKAAARIGCC